MDTEFTTKIASSKYVKLRRDLRGFVVTVTSDKNVKHAWT